jgi:hypothetical protein
MASLGLIEGGTGFSLNTKRHNNVLVHELVHQLTPDAYLAPGALGWFSEGLAEYMAITPYNWGYYQAVMKRLYHDLRSRRSATTPSRMAKIEQRKWARAAS